MKQIEKHFRKTELNDCKPSISGIDSIYLINLDQRPEKLERSLNQLRPFGVAVRRLSAIYGWSLSQEAFNDFGLKFDYPMDFTFDRQVFFRLASDQLDIPEPLNASCYGKTCVHRSVSAGAIGGALSHLSCLQDAWDKGDKTIWILEDDFTLNENPHLLSDYLQKFDQLAAWDVLHTDDDMHFKPYGPISIYLRPDRPCFTHCMEHKLLGKDFFKIGGRWQLHSVIYRRSGMQKILEYVKQFGLFKNLDEEINFVPGIQVYNLKCGLVHGRDRTTSDTQKNFFAP